MKLWGRERSVRNRGSDMAGVFSHIIYNFGRMRFDRLIDFVSYFGRLGTGIHERAI